MPSEYTLHFGDCIPHMAEMPAESVDLAVFSPPFSSLFAYTSEACDIGNSEMSGGEARLHLSFFYHQLRRILKPGRAACVHVMQIPRLRRTQEYGLHDFRGLNIRLGLRAGLVYDYDWMITKNPQTEAIRTRSHALQFASLGRDRAAMHGQLADYVIKFMAPGHNAAPVTSDGEVSRNDWIAWAESAWAWNGGNGIRQTYTLNTAEAKSEEDTKHICPLQLDVIERIVRMFSNPGELVFSPFAGIGSEGFVALRLGRRFYGCEIKQEYYDAAIKNLGKGIAARTKERQESLFEVA